MNAAVSGYFPELPPTPAPLGGPVPNREIPGTRAPAQKRCPRCKFSFPWPAGFTDTGKTSDVRARCNGCMRALRVRRSAA